VADRPTILGKPVVLHGDGRLSAQTPRGRVYLNPAEGRGEFFPRGARVKVRLRFPVDADRERAIGQAEAFIRKVTEVAHG
jgi:hypothetical protein